MRIPRWTPALAAWLTASVALAQETAETEGTPFLNTLNKIADGGGYTTVDQPSTAVGRLIALIGLLVQGLLAFLGVIFMLLMIYAGFRWMLARGNEGMVEEAKNTIRSASIGLVIIILAFAIVTAIGFIIKRAEIFQ